MIFRRAILIAWAGLPLAAPGEDMTTLAGQTYSNVTIQSYDRNGFYIHHDGGTNQVPFPEIAPELRGHYKALSQIPLPLDKLGGQGEAPAGPNDLPTRSGEIYRNVEVKQVGTDFLRIVHDSGLATVYFSAIAPDRLEKFRTGMPVVPLPAPGASDLVTAYGQVFRGIEIIRDEPDGLTFRHTGGVTKLAFPALPEELQKKYNYDPIAARAYAREVAAKRLAASAVPLVGSESGGPALVTIYNIETDALADNTFWIRFSVQNLTGEAQAVRVVPCEDKLAEITRGKTLEIPPRGDVKLQQIVVPALRPTFLAVHCGTYRTNTLLTWKVPGTK